MVKIERLFAEILLSVSGYRYMDTRAVYIYTYAYTSLSGSYFYESHSLNGYYIMVWYSLNTVYCIISMFVQNKMHFIRNLRFIHNTGHKLDGRV